jgi:hypothetical protein
MDVHAHGFGPRFVARVVRLRSQWRGARTSINIRNTFLALATFSLLVGCTTIRDSGELVRHYFGYVKVITPAVHAPDAAVRVLEVENYGVWLGVDRRPAAEDAAGYGVGLGYRRDRRELIPLDCRVVVRLATRQQMAEFLELLEKTETDKEGICAIQD